MFKALHQRFILPALNKSIVGNTVKTQVQAVLFAECLHILHEAKHMRRDSVHIKRKAEYHCLSIRKLR
jgi:hypothetical protein